MSYVLPQVLVYQEFTLAPTPLVEPLRACVIGPHYELRRYEHEHDDIGIGAYNPLVETCYSWPDRSAGGVVDDDSVRVFFEDAYLQYFEDLVGSGSIIRAVSGYKNRVRAESLIWKTGNGYNRSGVFYDRDVAVGDRIWVRAVVCGALYELWSYVVGFAADIIDDIIAAPTIDVHNQGAESASTSYAQIVGPSNCIDLTPDGSAYNGLETCDVTEIYTIEVIQGSTGGDATTAELSVVSASGNDDDLSLIPNAFGVPTPIGARGLMVTFDNVCPSSSSSPGPSSSSSSGAPSSSSGAPVDQDDFIVGQKWTVTVTQAFTPPVPTSGGDYTGASDMTYIVTVTKGGTWAENPEVTVTTDIGTDISGPTIVADGVPFAIGTLGVLLTLTGGTGLCLGDRFYVAVTAEAQGPIRTLLLGHNLPDELFGICPSSSSSSSAVPSSSSSAAPEENPDLSVTLYIMKDMEVPEDREGFAPLVNWEPEATQICMKPGIIGYDATWKNGSTLLPMPVVQADMYVEYRALLTASECVGVLQSLDSITDVTTTLGPAVPENPISLGVYKALQNSNNTEVKYICTPSDDVAGYTAALDVLVGKPNVYSLVPMTYNVAVQQLVEAHIDEMSTPERGRWRIGWFCQEAEPTIAIETVDSSGDPLTATVTDDPSAAGTQYTFVEDNEGTFLTGGVRAGDIYRTNYTTDGFGNVTYDEYVIDAVLNEQSLRLLTGPSVEYPVPIKYEIWRNLTKTEIASELGTNAGLFASRRVYMVWPDIITGTTSEGEEDMEGYFLCAALAGLRSGVQPHQGLTNVEINGFTEVTRTTEYFNETQLNSMAERGIWIVTQDPSLGTIYSRHQLSTDTADIKVAEQSVTTDIDAVSFVLLRAMEPYIGRGNLTPTYMERIRAQINAYLSHFTNIVTVERLGPMLLDARITEFREHDLLPDRLVVTIAVDPPIPLNNIEIHLVIG